jgi:hypothetical protein
MRTIGRHELKQAVAAILRRNDATSSSDHDETQRTEVVSGRLLHGFLTGRGLHRCLVSRNSM